MEEPKQLGFEQEAAEGGILARTLAVGLVAALDEADAVLGEVAEGIHHGVDGIHGDGARRGHAGGGYGCGRKADARMRFLPLGSFACFLLLSRWKWVAPLYVFCIEELRRFTTFACTVVHCSSVC